MLGSMNKGELHQFKLLQVINENKIKIERKFRLRMESKWDRLHFSTDLSLMLHVSYQSVEKQFKEANIYKFEDDAQKITTKQPSSPSNPQLQDKDSPEAVKELPKSRNLTSTV